MEGNATKASALHGRKGNDLSFNKIISRSSSLGCSSRASYYYQSHEGVPFEWEMQPGTPKEPPRADCPLPPLSPPPAVLSLALPKPCVEDCHPTSRKEFPPRLMRLQVWKKMIKKYWFHKVKKEVERGHSDEEHHKVHDDVRRVLGADKFEESFEFWSSGPRDGSMASPLESSRSSSASSLSFSNGPAVEPKKMNPLHDQPRISCIPFKLNAILLYVAKRS